MEARFNKASNVRSCFTKIVHVIFSSSILTLFFLTMANTRIRHVQYVMNSATLPVCPKISWWQIINKDQWVSITLWHGSSVNSGKYEPKQFCRTGHLDKSFNYMFPLVTAGQSAKQWGDKFLSTDWPLAFLPISPSEPDWPATFLRITLGILTFDMISDK